MKITKKIATFMCVLLIVSTVAPLKAQAEHPVHVKFSTYSNPKYKKFKRFIGDKVSAFSQKNLSDVPCQDIFYPFGGPDILYPLLLFPDFQSLTLVGLEKPGNHEDDEKWLFPSINKQLDSLMRRGFFITSQMQVSLRNGALPIILAQISLLKGTILNIETYSKPYPSIVIRFALKGKEREIRYIQKDLSDPYWREDIYPWKGPVDVCMMKSSSYMPHHQDFSQLTNYLLKSCNAIFQDDSGLPIRTLVKSKEFDISYFGKYTLPYGREFKGYTQPDLIKHFKNDHSHPSLNFCYGYGCGRQEPALIFAKKKAVPNVNAKP